MTLDPWFRPRLGMKIIVRFFFLKKKKNPFTYYLKTQIFKNAILNEIFL